MRLPEYPPLRLLSCYPLESPLALPFEFAPDRWEPVPVASVDDAEHEIYLGLVGAIEIRTQWVSRNPSAASLLELDAYLSLAAFMDVTGCYSDRELAPELFRVSPALDLSHTLRSMPDIGRLMFDLKFWTKKCSSDWATLLNKAMPLPCKGRNLEKAFATAIEYDAVFNFVLQVLFGCFLGLYQGRKACLRRRIVLYAVFSVFPPTVEQLRSFILANKPTVALCVESFNLFSMGLGVFHDFLAKTYRWDVVTENRAEAVCCLQECVDDLIDRFGLKFMDMSRSDVAAAWAAVGPKLKAFSVAFKKFCFRPVTQSITSCVVAQAFKVWRKNVDFKCYTGLIDVPIEVFQYVWDIPYDPQRQEEFDGATSLLPARFFDQKTRNAWKKVRWDYYMEKTMTGPQHFMAGTEKKKTGLFFTDPKLFFEIFVFCLTVENRRKVRWAPLPREWAIRQANALVIPGTGGISPYAGQYYICPNCAKARCAPVTFPDGMFKDKRERARYSHQTRVDFGTMEVSCKDFSKRRKEQIIKRRKRKGKDCDNIRVCSDTHLVRFCMIGMVLWTEQDGNLVLCVDCGTMVSWTPECYSDRGPTCGCQLQAPPPRDPGTCRYCKRAFSARTKFTVHSVLNELTGDLEHVKICNRHGTAWKHKLPYMFTLAQLFYCIDNDKYAFLLHGKTPIFCDKQ